MQNKKQPPKKTATKPKRDTNSQGSTLRQAAGPGAAQGVRSPEGAAGGLRPGGALPRAGRGLRGAVPGLRGRRAKWVEWVGGQGERGGWNTKPPRRVGFQLPMVGGQECWSTPTCSSFFFSRVGGMGLLHMMAKSARPAFGACWSFGEGPKAFLWMCPSRPGYEFDYPLTATLRRGSCHDVLFSLNSVVRRKVAVPLFPEGISLHETRVQPPGGSS